MEYLPDPHQMIVQGEDWKHWNPFQESIDHECTYVDPHHTIDTHHFRTLPPKFSFVAQTIETLESVKVKMLDVTQVR